LIVGYARGGGDYAIQLMDINPSISTVNLVHTLTSVAKITGNSSSKLVYFTDKGIRYVYDYEGNVEIEEREGDMHLDLYNDMVLE
jgi:hypothetical protein